MDELQEFLAARNAALVALDMDYARKQAPHLSDEVLLIGMHKARYECKAIPASMRIESGEWLRERSYQGMCGPLLPKGDLPC